MPSNSIIQKVQQSVREMLRGSGLDWIDENSIVSGISRGPMGDDLDSEAVSTPLPSIVCQCQSANRIYQPNSGNWEATLLVMIRENADDTTEDEHLERCGQVADILMDTKQVESDLSEFPDFFVEFFSVESMSYDLADRSWRTTIQATVRCCGRTINENT